MKTKSTPKPEDDRPITTAISPESLLGVIRELVLEVHPEAAQYKDLTLDSSLGGDLGLDSLAMMELLSRLERKYGIRLSEEALGLAETPRDLLQYAYDKAGSRPEIQGVDTESKKDERRVEGLPGANTLVELLELYVKFRPEANHITLLEGDEELRISYQNLKNESLKVLGTLLDHEVEPGDRVAIMLPTCREYFYSFFAILFAGAVPVPLYPPARPAQIEEHVRRHRKILNNAQAKLLITIPQVKTVGLLLQSQVEAIRSIVTVDELYGSPPTRLANTTRGDDIAFLQYTSGSTGDPKGVVLTHANLLANVRAMGRVCEVSEEDVFISWLPLYHDMGLIGAWFGSLYHGCRLVVMSPLAFLAQPERWLKTVTRFRGTLSASPNFGYEICGSRLDDQQLEGLDLSSWRLAFNGAEPVLPGTMSRFAKRFEKYGFSPCALTPVYGLAECSVGLLFPPPGRGMVVDRVDRDEFMLHAKAEAAAVDDDSSLEFVCVGRPLPEHQVRVVDDNDRELPEKWQGRLQFKGPSATSGYFRNSDQTARLIRGSWLETGDLGYVAAGEVYLTGRQKDIIIRAGRNIHPHELEKAVGEIEGIRRGCTAVFGATRDGTGEEKLVVLTESRITAEEELARLRKEVQQVTFTLLGVGADDVVIARPGTVLKTSSGKIRRSACSKAYLDGELGKSKGLLPLRLFRLFLESLIPMIRRVARQLGSSLYAGYCWSVLTVLGGLVWLAMLVLPAGRQCWRLSSLAVRMIARLVGIELTIKGTPLPDEGQYILVSNHQSYLDGIMLTGLLPTFCRYVAKRELAGNFFLRVGLEKLGVFLVDRFDPQQGAKDTEAIENGIDEEGYPLFFAEGTLQRMPGLLPFQMGAFVLAARKNIPIIPVVIQGTRNILREGSWFPRRGKVSVTILNPCSPQDEGWESAVELRHRVRESMLAALDEPDLGGEYSSLLQMGVKRVREKR